MGVKVLKARDQHLEYDDYEVGDEFETAMITITETHLVMFASLFGDLNMGHSCDHYTKEISRGIAAGRKVVHGHLVLVMGAGLLARMGVMMYTKTGAYMGMPNWRILRPAYVGDSITAKFKVLEKKVNEKKPEWGMLTFGMSIYNHDGELLQTAENLHYFWLGK
jgi:3-hydroxybutyryl-CoA dehydratase